MDLHVIETMISILVVKSITASSITAHANLSWTFKTDHVIIFIFSSLSQRLFTILCCVVLIANRLYSHTNKLRQLPYLLICTRETNIPN